MRRLSLLAVVAAAGVAASSASASFPGANGQIAFAVQSNYFCGGVRPGLAAAVYSFKPSAGVTAVDFNDPLLRRAGDPDWSPSGARLAAARYVPIYGHSGMGYDTKGVFTTLADATHRTTLTTHGLAPAWSGEGRQIAYAGDERGLRVIGTRGGRSRLLDSHRVLDVDWSARGKIAYTRGFYSIYTIDPNGRHRRFVVHGLEPDWSPDGRQLVFRESAGGIAIVNANGTGFHEIRHDARGFSPVWSPDGTQIAFTENSDTIDGDVFVMNSDGTGERQVAELTPDPCGDESLVTDLDWQRVAP